MIHIDSGNMILFKKAQEDQLQPTNGVQNSQAAQVDLKEIKKEEKPLKELEQAEMVEVFSKFVNGGRANEKEITAKDVDPNELAMGIEVEHEHTTDKQTAERIALDHLAEIKDYYTRLKKMEEEGKASGAEVKQG